MYGKDHTLFMEPPHLWVFSNDVPNLAFCSIDRWKVYELKDTHSDLVEMTHKQIIKEGRKNAKADLKAATIGKSDDEEDSDVEDIQQDDDALDEDDEAPDEDEGFDDVYE
jgi:hypothetical protein